MIPVHRLAWELTYGTIPGGLCVCHKCDNPPCVRPDHLFLGTKAENSADMVLKGRSPKGSRNGQARFAEAEIFAIREAYASGLTQVELAQMYSTSQTTISGIVRRATWKHL
jgi:hypothetical protein